MEGVPAGKELIDSHADHACSLNVLPEMRPRNSKSGCWTLLLWIVTVTVTLLGLTGLLLGDVPGLAVKNFGQGAQQSSEPVHDGDVATTQAPSTPHVVVDEVIPASPSWRSHNDYILSQTWDDLSGPAIREYNWTVTDAMFNPDGVYRPMVLINNQFPGPLVEANEGDTIIVHVRNRAVNATSIHFHGMYLNGTSSMDGTIGVTQCPIAPGTDYTYKFTIHGQSGTYWYHAHHSAQATDGLVGPVVVHPKKSINTPTYSSDRIIMIQDHYHNTTSELLMDYLQPGRENEEPVPDSALINGRGFRSCADFPGWHCDDSKLAYPEIQLTRGEKHRLRIINVGAFAEFNVQVDEHPFHVTEVDGTEVVHDEPIHKLAILPAQRYSIVLETHQTTERRHEDHDADETDTPAFWFRAGMLTTCFTGENPHMNPDIRAVVRYVNKGEGPQATVQPNSKPWDDVVDSVCRDLDTAQLRPVDAITPPVADDYITLRASFRIGAWRLSRGFFNETTWHPNITSPLLHRFLDEASNAAEVQEMPWEDSTKLSAAISLASPTFFDPDHELILQTTPGNAVRTVDIAINNFDDGAHPFHLHGHKFFVLTPSLKGAPPATKQDLDTLLQTNYSRILQNPVRRDTVTVAGYEWVVIRVVLDNPGIWALHCHNTWHGESGMAMQIVVRPDEIVRQQRDTEGGLVGDVEREMCRKDGVTKGSRPADSIWFGHF
ncbi:multicopper oxidase [Microdochium trichocladiopsis]|uniref:Multicopper oxidase n=1 Tax=Microdochium trichocladiopsis TaxID=1682393 RepID=A0A9P9BVU1_9PEZI|nr:multicopper oxidase [Microdochium trichocladiopsis]KAH7033672.1 multicopper oxidase [Microdochium trichocladiopsis]